MEVISGNIKFSGIAIGELTVNRMGPTLKMEAKAAFVDPKTGVTHGWTTGSQWSKETVAKLNELFLLMEADLAKAHFVDAGTSDDGPVTISRPTGVGGLGEHVIGREGEQV